VSVDDRPQSAAKALQPVEGVDLSDVIAAEFDIKVVAGRGLIAKDGGGLLGGKRTSDPYVVVRYRKISHQSPHVEDSLDPTWDWACKFVLQGKDFRPNEILKKGAAIRARSSFRSPPS
jgi:hypothetical protein